MQVLYPRCAGLDVHKDTVVACVRVMEGGEIKTEVRTFKTMTSQLLELSDWLSDNGCTHVAMEASGVYWKCVWAVLSDDEFTLVLANAAHVKNVPGRKTDVNDATWLAELLAHGLVRSSFVPDPSSQELRNLLRTRKQLVRERSRHVQRVQKTLEEANVKLASVISDVMGRSGRAIIEAIIKGETDAAKLAGLAQGRVRASQTELTEALRGRVTKNHRFLLKLHLQQIDAIETAIDAVDKEVDAHLREKLNSFRDAIELLKSIPGVSELSAITFLSEIGADMTRFPTAGHLVSWAGLCPKSDQSAGKRRSNRLRKSAPWLKTALVQSAWAAVRAKGTYLQAQFHRLRARRGATKAICAVASSILTAIYHMLKDGTFYKDLGPQHFQRRSKHTQARRLLRSLEYLGYAVQITSLAPELSVSS
jgi:transposase